MRFSAWLGICCVLAWVPAVGLRADVVDMSSWYTFAPRSTPEPGEIGMQDWLSKPAGKDGRITRERDKLYYNGKPIKLWGTQPVLQCLRAGAGARRQAGRVLSQVRDQLRAAAQVCRWSGLVRDSIQG